MVAAIITVIGLNLAGYLLAYFRQTDKLTDLTYSASFIALVVACGYQADAWGGTQLIIAAMVFVWGLRLGGYLFYRILRMGRDRRFDEMRPSPLRFAGFWILQTLSVLVIGSPVLIALAAKPSEVGIITICGVVIWLSGFILETVADAQKFRFKAVPENRDQPMQSGLWAYVRHPNYLGEIMVWAGIFIACAPCLEGITWITIISPIWIFVLLRYISGIPLLEESAMNKYGDSHSYREYLRSTGLLLPRIR